MQEFLKFNFWNKTLNVSDSSSVHHQEFIIRIYHDARSPERQIRQCQTGKGNISV
jgi:hypothetical protein